MIRRGGAKGIGEASQSWGNSGDVSCRQEDAAPRRVDRRASSKDRFTGVPRETFATRPRTF